jgi:hypothetical protein
LSKGAIKEIISSASRRSLVDTNNQAKERNQLGHISNPHGAFSALPTLLAISSYDFLGSLVLLHLPTEGHLRPVSRSLPSRIIGKDSS